MSTLNQPLRIIARSLFRDLRSHGYAPNQIVTLATEILSLIADDLRAGAAPPGLRR